MISYKPEWCRIWPRNQADVDSFNKAVLTEYPKGHKMHGKQCQLKFKDKPSEFEKLQRITVKLEEKPSE